MTSQHSACMGEHRAQRGAPTSTPIRRCTRLPMHVSSPHGLAHATTHIHTSLPMHALANAPARPCTRLPVHPPAMHQATPCAPGVHRRVAQTRAHAPDTQRSRSCEGWSAPPCPTTHRSSRQPRPPAADAHAGHQSSSTSATRTCFVHIMGRNRSCVAVIGASATGSCCYCRD